MNATHDTTTPRPRDGFRAGAAERTRRARSVAVLLAILVLGALTGCGQPAADWSIEVGSDAVLAVPVGDSIDFRLAIVGAPPPPVTWSKPAQSWLVTEVSPDDTALRVRGRAPMGATINSPYDVSITATAADGSSVRSETVRVTVRPLVLEFHENDTATTGSNGTRLIPLQLGYRDLPYLPESPGDIRVFVNTANLHYEQHRCAQGSVEYCQDKLRISDDETGLTFEQGILAQVTRNSSRPDLGEVLRSDAPEFSQAFSDGAVDLTVVTVDDEQWYLFGIWVTIE